MDYNHYLDRFQEIVYMVLITLLLFVIAYSVIELVFTIAAALMATPFFRLENKDFLSIFGFFLLIFIGIELLESMRMYFKEKKIQVEVIVLLALIVIARKVILIDVADIDSIVMFGIAALIIALSLGYYLLKKAGSGGEHAEFPPS